MDTKVAVITGAGGGIGRALALKFGPAGYRLALWDVAPSEPLAEQLREQQIPFSFQTVDITRAEAVETATQEVVSSFGPIDVLINNAGITRDRLLFRMEEADWDAVLNVNLKGAFLCSKIIGKVMYSRKSGRLVNIASIIGQMGNIGQANYAAAKGGLIALTKTCAKEFARYGVLVNAIAPGFIMTRMTEGLPEKIREQMLNAVPLRRFGTAAEVADLAFFLCSAESKYITGQVIRVDGGLLM